MEDLDISRGNIAPVRSGMRRMEAEGKQGAAYGERNSHSFHVTPSMQKSIYFDGKLRMRELLNCNTTRIAEQQEQGNLGGREALLWGLEQLPIGLNGMSCRRHRFAVEADRPQHALAT
jgi:hypothetical protein